MDLGPALSEPPTFTPRVDAEGKRFGPRALSYILDLIVVNVANFAVGFVGGSAFGLGLYFIAALFGYEPVFATPSTLLNFLTGILISFGYFIAFEALCGATPGKLVLAMRVVTLNGDRPPLYGATVRALWRLLDGLFFGLVAASSMKAPLHQRYGDKHAKTLVVASSSPILRFKPSIPYFVLGTLAYFTLSFAIQVGSLLLYTTFLPIS